ncbi:CaiB/BaiF CoA transferase family protein [Streptomyces sp. UG1]|uniref:CaiB/BaiF CoA transferase family protein n=1 Tax=Streptomyces sp. UG1 TaxID=3417652 RepID=UPI003CF867AE
MTPAPPNDRPAGALSRLRVLEFAGKGPAPFAAMLLADFGADVVRIERVPLPDRHPDYRPELDVLQRGRPGVGIDLRSEEGHALAFDLVERADILLEGYRPGAMERLGLGPEQCLERNPRLVYGRATGWGQDGPLAQDAGHDINFLAMSGLLSMLGRADAPPTPPANLLADFGGGGMLLTVGVLAATLSAVATGEGQVVDAAMLEGGNLLSALLHGLRASGQWSDRRGTNLLDTGAPYYDVYATADEEWIAVGAVEPKFYRALLGPLGLAEDELFADQADRSRWPAMRERLSAAFRSRSRDEWVRTFEGVDACVSPVLSVDEAEAHPHNRRRALFVTEQGVRQPAPAPKFSRTPARVQPVDEGRRTEPLASWGVTSERMGALVDAKAVAPVD